jgi:uncharacterized 2Fe-2S/4Fe-4S cluster protein (DUF4445 family)
MPKLTLLPLNQTLDLEPGETVAEALQRLGVEFEEPCGGQGICGHCRVWVQEHERVPPTPHEAITEDQAGRGLRLACQITPRCDLTARLFAEPDPGSERILEADDLGVEQLAPAARVTQTEDGSFWLHYQGRPQPGHLETWDADDSPKGLGVDLGTTTLVVTLVCLRSGTALATDSAINPQNRFGHDVMTRITKGSSPEGLAELAREVRAGLNRLVESVCARSRCDPSQVVDVVIGGNTTMLQLAAQIDPAPLGRSPFAIGISGGESYRAEQFGLVVNPAARVYLPPVAHAFFGSDVSAGLTTCDGFFDGPEIRLFIDVGTNGELSLSTPKRWIFSSAAAGPAFEGMGISSGMRAAAGAIDAASIAGETLELRTIGNAPARGICGSGILDVVACLLKLGVLDPSGRMRRPADSAGLTPFVASRLQEVDGKAAFCLAEDVFFTQQDVRQVQLAKGAIRTAIDMFLSETGTSPSAVDEVLLAGAFGSSLRARSLQIIGMIPPGMADRVSFLGNTSLRGCVGLLLDAEKRRFIERKMEDMEHLSLAERPEFMEQFLCQMSFPDPSLSPADR